jgi:hypothetical protein
MKNLKMICFDMDGTVADFYGVEGWLNDLENGNVRPYIEAEPLLDMEELGEVLMAFKNLGTEIRIITWLGQGADVEFKNATRIAKAEWLETHNFVYDKAHMVQYGTTKADCIRAELAEDEYAILFDDNEKVRRGWHMGTAYDVDDIIGTLYAVLAEIVGE